jgi:hypothetical protein
MASYITVSEAQTYFNDRLDTDPWDCATSTNKSKALSMATKIIDRLNYQGCKATDAQELQFPRDDDTVVPQDIKDATAEIALALLDGVDPEMEYQNLSMTSQAYGKVKSNYDRSIVQEHVLVGLPSITAWRLVKPYVRDPRTVDLNRVS